MSIKEGNIENEKASESEEDYYTCAICNESKPRRAFSKKFFAIRNCQFCRQSQTAKRNKQPLPKNATLLLSNRKAASGVTRRPNNFGYCHYVDHVMSLKCYPEMVSLRVFATAKDISESMAAIHAASHRMNNNNNNNITPQKVLCLCIGDGNTPRTAVLAAYWKQWTCVSIDPNLEPEWEGVHPQGVRGLTGVRGTLEEYLESLQSSAPSSAVPLPSPTNPNKTKDNYCQPIIPANTSVAAAPNSTEHSQELTVKETNGTNPQAVEKDTIILVLLCVHSHVRFQNQATLSRVRALHSPPLTTTVTTMNMQMIMVSIPCCPGFRHVTDVGRPPDQTYEDDCVFSACRTVNIWQFSGEERLS